MARRLPLLSLAPNNPRMPRKLFVRAAIEQLEDRLAPALFNPMGAKTSTYNNASWAALADFNNDNKLDMAVAGYSSNNVVVMLGDGAGGFGSGVGNPIGGTQANFVDVGDFNGDGNMDIVATVLNNTSGTGANEGAFQVLLGDGAGNFTPAAGSPFDSNGFKPYAVVVADLVGNDGIPDLAICNFGVPQGTESFVGNNVSIFQGHVDSVTKKVTFTLAQTITNGIGFNPTSIAAGDFNGDGKTDLVVVAPGIPANPGDPPINGYVTLITNNGSGSFSLGTTYDSGGIYPVNVRVADVAGPSGMDGKPDIVVANAGDVQNPFNFGSGNSATVLINSGTGGFSNSKTIVADIASAFAVAPADYDGDGKGDIAVANFGGLSGGGYLSAYVGDGTGNFTAASGSPYNGAASVGGGQVVVSGDLDGNGTPDVVLLGDGNQYQVFMNTTTPAAATNIGLAATPATSSTYGDPVTLTATVTATGGGTPTSGTVTFFDGGVSIGSGAVNGSGVATYNPTLAQLPAGTHSFTAKYGGAAGFAASPLSSPVSYKVNTASTTTSLTATPNPVIQGATVKFTATVTGPGTPTGTVTFWEGATQLSSGTLSGGTATFSPSTATWALGDHMIVAKYADQANWIGSSGSFTVTVNAPASVNTTTVVGSTLNPSMATQQVTLVATVGAISGIPTGTVNFFDAGVPIGSAPLTTVGTVQQAMLPVSTLAIGSHQITAQYVGTTGFNPSTSPAITQVVNPITTTVSVVSSGSPALATQPVTFTATVGVVLGAAIGTVSFFDGTTFIGSGVLTTVGGQQVATVTATGLAVGPHAITAQYAAQGNFAGSNSGPFNQSVNAVGTGVAATSGLNPATAGQTVTFTATVVPVATIPLPPTGSVTFFDGTTALATVPVTGTTASFSTSTLSVGTHSITAVYSGDPNYTGSTSPAVTETINPTSPPPPPPPSPLLVGYREFGVGAGAGAPATVRFFNPDGSERFTVDAFPGFTGGVRTAAADFNGDGVADLVVGTGPGGPTHVRVIDGVTQKELFAVDPFEATFTGGVYVAAGDVNGDGVPDLVITPDEGGGPRVRIFSGKAAFAQLDDFFGIDDTAFRGGARAAVGDINGDGAGDLVVAAGFLGGPRVAAFNGKTLGTNNRVKLFADFFAFESTLRNGAFVTVGDVDGDGRAELIAGGGPGGGPRVTAFSGSSLMGNAVVPVANFFAGNTDNRGGIRLAVKNLDNDSQADLVVGDGTDAGSHVTGYLGKALRSPSTPPSVLSFDAFPGFTGGVYVG